MSGTRCASTGARRHSREFVFADSLRAFAGISRHGRTEQSNIEGNRLILPEIEAVIEQQQAVPAGKERDAAEARHYWQSLLKTEEWAAAGTALTGEMIRRLHGIKESPAGHRNRNYLQLTRWRPAMMKTAHLMLCCLALALCLLAPATAAPRAEYRGRYIQGKGDTDYLR
ncbi:MAG: hypothetical protein IT210_18175 [Armatimonadetes bacterium]|nr:hypothetical protein [Armatimonadota bacterium]